MKKELAKKKIIQTNSVCKNTLYILQIAISYLFYTFENLCEFKKMEKDLQCKKSKNKMEIDNVGTQTQSVKRPRCYYCLCLASSSFFLSLHLLLLLQMVCWALIKSHHFMPRFKRFLVAFSPYHRAYIHSKRAIRDCGS